MEDIDSEKFNGALFPLIGIWEGNKGIDISPEPDGEEKAAYFETITIAPVGDAVNAEEQTLVALQYTQSVTRKSDNKLFHHQVGYWYLDKEKDELFYSLTIPRAMCVLAQGRWAVKGNVTEYELVAHLDDKHYGIIQSKFLEEKATTRAFQMQLSVDGDTMRYKMLTNLHIYGRDFEHTDENILTRVV